MGFISTTLTLSETLTNLTTVSTSARTGPVPDAIGIASTAVVKWKAPSQVIDQLALNVFNKIKRRQLDIATLGSNVGLSSQCYSDSTSVLTTLYGSLVSGASTALGQSLGISGVGTQTVVAYGVIYYDTLDVYRYPNLETLNVSTENPLDGGGYVSLGTTTLGIGNNTRYAVGVGTAAATVFAYASSKSGIAATCADYTGIAASISSVKAQYDAEAAGIATYVTDVNVIKGFKHSAQLEWWSLNKADNNLQVGITSNNSVAAILSSPAYGGPY